MFITTTQLILASSSPRRQAYLRDLGIEYTIATANVDETPQNGESPIDYVDRMAYLKCRCVADTHDSAWVLSADTIVFMGSKIFGKPLNKQKAVETLVRLSGKTHSVATSFNLWSKPQAVIHKQTVISSVTFFSFSEEIAQVYVNTGEYKDKAGGYGIQGRGSFLVREIAGSYTNVVGLPLSEVVDALIKYGIVKTKC